ncbi:MAG: DsbC family protein [Aeromicrobium sp.]|nr:DsbC family protein [Burkholderiales bacterium]
MKLLRNKFEQRIFNQRVELMKKILIALAATLFAVSCGVQANPDEVKKELAKKFPDLKTERITKTTYGGLFEVFTGTEIFYTDEKATFVLAGNLIDTATRANVSEARINKLSAIKFDELPFENAIKIVRGDGSRRIAIFEDPLCGYCKKFEADVNSMTNITAYVFLYPILAQDSLVKSKAIWCSKDKGAAWQDWMLRDKAPASPAPESCVTPVDQNVALGKKLRINGTPVTFFVDGERVVGALPLATIEAKLASAVAPAILPTAATAVPAKK